MAKKFDVEWSVCATCTEDQINKLEEALEKVVKNFEGYVGENDRVEQEDENED